MLYGSVNLCEAQTESELVKRYGNCVVAFMNSVT